MSDQLQIGTVHLYIDHDQKFIRDFSEGKARYIIQVEKYQEVPGKVFEQFTGAQVQDNVVIRAGGTVEMNYRIPNNYIFCASEVEKPSIALAESLGYDSFYVINDATAFNNELAAGIQNYISEPSNEWKLNRFGIHMLDGPVSYSDDKVIKLNVFDPVQIIRSGLFIKSTFAPHDRNITFAENKEYRFVWLIDDLGGGLLHPLDVNPILIPITTEMRRICA
jgi:hypothetical protein